MARVGWPGGCYRCGSFVGRNAAASIWVGANWRCTSMLHFDAALRDLGVNRCAERTLRTGTAGSQGESRCGGIHKRCALFLARTGIDS